MKDLMLDSLVVLPLSQGEEAINDSYRPRVGSRGKDEREDTDLHMNWTQHQQPESATCGTSNFSKNPACNIIASLSTIVTPSAAE